MLTYLVGRVNEISHLSTEEYIKLRASLHAIDNRKYICSECKQLDAGRQDYAERSQRRREMMGCFDLKPQVMHRIGTEILFNGCIGNYFDFSVMSLLEMERLYQLGSMPYPGSQADQPNKAVEAFRVIQSYKIDKLKADQAKQSKDRSRTAVRRGR